MQFIIDMSIERIWFKEQDFVFYFRALTHAGRSHCPYRQRSSDPSIRKVDDFAEFYDQRHILILFFGLKLAHSNWCLHVSGREY